jgi:hypothetical protein
MRPVARLHFPLIDRSLGGYVNAATRQDMKACAVARAAAVRAQVPAQLTATNALPMVNCCARTTTPQALVFGETDPFRTRSVLVNGVAAEWTAWSGRWTNVVPSLRPGLNFLKVEALVGDGLEVLSPAHSMTP